MSTPRALTNESSTSSGVTPEPHYIPDLLEASTLTRAMSSPLSNNQVHSQKQPWLYLNLTLQFTFASLINSLCNDCFYVKIYKRIKQQRICLKLLWNSSISILMYTIIFFSPFLEHSTDSENEHTTQCCQSDAEFTW